MEEPDGRGRARKPRPAPASPLRDAPGGPGWGAPLVPPRPLDATRRRPRPAAPALAGVAGRRGPVASLRSCRRDQRPQPRRARPLRPRPCGPRGAPAPAGPRPPRGLLAPRGRAPAPAGNCAHRQARLAPRGPSLSCRPGPRGRSGLLFEPCPGLRVPGRGGGVTQGGGASQPFPGAPRGPKRAPRSLRTHAGEPPGSWPGPDTGARPRRCGLGTPHRPDPQRLAPPGGDGALGSTRRLQAGGRGRGLCVSQSTLRGTVCRQGPFARSSSPVII